MEARQRDAGRRIGEVVTSRRRDPDATDYGRYWLIDAETTMLLVGGQWGTDLDEIEDYLTSP